MEIFSPCKIEFYHEHVDGSAPWYVTRYLTSKGAHATGIFFLLSCCEHANLQNHNKMSKGFQKKVLKKLDIPLLVIYQRTDRKKMEEGG